MAVVFLALFLVTFLFDTRIGLFFLVLALIMFYRGGSERRLKELRADHTRPQPPAWKDPWATGGRDS